MTRALTLLTVLLVSVFLLLRCASPYMGFKSETYMGRAV